MPLPDRIILASVAVLVGLSCSHSKPDSQPCSPKAVPFDEAATAREVESQETLAFKVVDSGGDTRVVIQPAMEFGSGPNAFSIHAFRFTDGDLSVQIPMACIRKMTIGSSDFRDPVKIELVDGHVENLPHEGGTLQGFTEVAGQRTPFSVHISDLRSITAMRHEPSS